MYGALMPCYVHSPGAINCRCPTNRYRLGRSLTEEHDLETQNPPWRRAGVPANREFMCVAAKNFPEIRSQVKRKYRFR